MKRFLVGIARCETYEPPHVSHALQRVVKRAGGWPDCAADLLLKTNMLSPSPPEKAVTTHPEVIRAAISLICDMQPAHGAIYVGDNPGYIFTDPDSLLAATGIACLGEIPGVHIGTLTDKGTKQIVKDDFAVLQEARVSSRYLETPVRINIAKLKTHVETEITGCVKNIFGIADIETRKRAHRSLSRRHLAEAILDLFCIAPPAFNILDAVVCMEGDGPSHGRPKQAGWLVASNSAAAADWVAATIMGYRNPASIPLLEAASRRGIGPMGQSDIELVGARWEELPVKGFKKSTNLLRLLPTFLRGCAHNLVSVYPKLNAEACIHCRICEKVCPVDAIREQNSLPQIDRDACVKCLCCHEMCPTGAMAAGKNWIASLVAGRRAN